MKTLITFLLVPLFLFSGLVSELGKVPALFSHFNEHRAQNAGLTLTGFLSMHYFGDDSDSSDNEKDNSLPFKKMKADEEVPALAAVNGTHSGTPFAFAENGRPPVPAYRSHSTDAIPGKDPRPPRLC